MRDLKQFREAVELLIDLTYDTGHIAGRAESGADIDKDYQLRKISARNEQKRVVMMLYADSMPAKKATE